MITPMIKSPLQEDVKNIHLADESKIRSYFISERDTLIDVDCQFAIVCNLLKNLPVKL